VTVFEISNNCARFESNTEVTIQFKISNIRTALIKYYLLRILLEITALIQHIDSLPVGLLAHVELSIS